MAIKFTSKPIEPATPIKSKPSRKGIGGRPKLEAAKVPITLRIDPRVLAHYRASGDGWQSRLNADLVRLCGF